MSSAPVIRIVRKKKAHEESHGGSWKVAYADFVTAMMAFFLVMWIISMDQPVKEDIQNYFNNPFSAAQSKAGISQLASGGETPFALGMRGAVNAKNWHQLALEAQRDRFRRTQETIESEILAEADLAYLKEHVEIEVTDAGLVIELIEGRAPVFFESGSARLPSAARRLLALVAREVGELPNPVAIEGHTDTVPYKPGAAYTNWELSADRANAARRAMEAAGARQGQVSEVRGCADSRLRCPDNPTHHTNRRVSILVRYSQPPANAPGEMGLPESAENNDGRPFDAGIRPLSTRPTHTEPPAH